MPISRIKEFLEFEAAGGLLLIGASAIALIVANSPASSHYAAFLNIPVAVQVGALEIDKPLLLWINDGLMAVFFFLVGLEIKREILEGELSDKSKASLPVAAAIGGMAAPAAIYAFMNMNDPIALSGWAIPAATDIAFALGILALVGSRAPLSLKVFLTAVAIIDDLGAILIIAFFYTENLSLLSLGLAAAGVAGLFLLNRFGVTRTSAYVLIGLFLWVCVLKSGVHATLAGVVVALAIPLRAKDEDGHSPLIHLEHTLHPWVAFMILPVFGFANAGVSFAGMGLDSFAHPVTLGIILGLALGKMVGVYGATWLAIKSGIAKRPENASWIQIYGVACLCGIGFTMSLFIGNLAFDDPAYAATIRLGVLTGSVVMAVLGFLLLRFCPSGREEKRS